MLINLYLDGIQHEINPHFHFLLEESHRVVVCGGGAGSGKSYSIIQSLLYIILRDIKTVKHTFVLLRKTSPAGRRSLFPLVKDLIDKWNLNSIVKVNITNMSFTFVNESQIIIIGLDDQEKLKSIYGVTKFFMEEATEFEVDDYYQLHLRMRAVKNVTFQILLAFNPISRNSWVFKEFFTKENKNILVDMSTYKDNPHLDEAYINTLESFIDIDENYFNIYTNGQWGSLGGLVYNKYSIVPPNTVVEGEVVYGLDFGYEHPCCLVRVSKYKDGFLVHEVLHKNKLTINDLLKVMDEIKTNKYFTCMEKQDEIAGQYEQYIIEQDTVTADAVTADAVTADTIPYDYTTTIPYDYTTLQTDYIYCDGSRPEAVEELIRNGYNARNADKHPGSVKTGIEYIKRYPIYITSNSTMLIKEIQAYSHKTDKNGQYLEEPIKIYDDAMDAMRYAIYSHYANNVNYKVYS